MNSIKHRVCASRLTLVLAAVAPAIALAAPVLVVDSGGVLTGVNNLEVQGTAYDVSFNGGTCDQLFSGCQSFAFQTVESAMAASEALLAYAFTDSGFGQFDSRPELTRGCESTPASTFYSCIALTPFALSPSGQIVSAFWALNSMREVSDEANTYGFLFTNANPIQSPGVQMRTWAVWTPSTVTPIPEPAPWQLTLLGVSTMLAVRKRATRQQKPLHAPRPESDA